LRDTDEAQRTSTETERPVSAEPREICGSRRGSNVHRFLDFHPEIEAAGAAIFNGQSCMKCHGTGGTGGRRGPILTDDTWIHFDGSYAAIVSLVTTGFSIAEQRDPEYRFTMNPRGGVNLTEDQIRNVAAYVWTLNHE
jgi:mono/diheme cytochrome c family protein